MTPATSEPLTITVAEGLCVSALFVRPAMASACYVLAHGAGAGMTHPFLEAVASELSDRAIATLRYNFPFVERRSKRPDPPARLRDGPSGRDVGSWPWVLQKEAQHLAAGVWAPRLGVRSVGAAP